MRRMTGGLNVSPKDHELYNSAYFASPYQPTPDLPELSSSNEPDLEDYSEREDDETELGAVEKTFLGDSNQNLSNEVLDDIIEVDGKTLQALPSELSLSRTELIDFSHASTCTASLRLITREFLCM